MQKVKQFIFEGFLSPPFPSCAASRVLYYVVTSPPPSAFPWGTTITFHFAEAYLFSIQAAAVVTDDIQWHKGHYLKQMHGIKASNQCFSLIDDKQLLPCISMSNGSENTRTCVSCTLWSLFLWASTVSGCQGRHDGGDVIIAPIWMHNDFRARHGGYE